MMHMTPVVRKSQFDFHFRHLKRLREPKIEITRLGNGMKR
jgi:hypothetical protein